MRYVEITETRKQRVVSHATKEISRLEDKKIPLLDWVKLVQEETPESGEGAYELEEIERIDGIIAHHKDMIKKVTTYKYMVSSSSGTIWSNERVF